jgi:hypothetical protein
MVVATAHLHAKQRLPVTRASWQIVLPKVGPLEQLMLRTEALLEEVSIHGGGERASIDAILCVAKSYIKGDHAASLGVPGPCNEHSMDRGTPRGSGGRR